MNLFWSIIYSFFILLIGYMMGHNVQQDFYFYQNQELKDKLRQLERKEAEE